MRLGCVVFPSWHYINNDCITTTGKVLKLNNIYTYDENGDVEIVRLTDVHFERGYLFCNLYFFSRNQIITVRQIMLKGSKIIWKLSDDREYDEIMSRRFWQDINGLDDLLEFDY